MKKPDLETERLILTDMTEEDAQNVVRWRSDPEVYRYFLNPHEITVEEHLGWFRNSYAKNADRIDWVVRVKSTGEPVGVFGIKILEKQTECAKQKTVELSYLLDQAAQHRGFAAEALCGMMDFAKREWGCEVAVAEIHKENDSSVRLVKRLDFVREEDSGDFTLWKKIL